MILVILLIPLLSHIGLNQAWTVDSFHFHMLTTHILSKYWKTGKWMRKALTEGVKGIAFERLDEVFAVFQKKNWIFIYFLHLKKKKWGI